MCDTSLKSCVPRHSGNLFEHFLNDVPYTIVQCVTRHSGIMFQSFPECRVKRDCAMCDTSFEKDVSYSSCVSQMIV